MSVAIITDSTSYIPEQIRNEHNIHMVPLSVVFGDSAYREEIDITAAEFYQKVKTVDQLPKTSQPSIGVMMETIEKLSIDYDQAIIITLSSGISGTYQTSVTAKDMAENIELFPYDSELSCLAQGFYVLEAAKLAKKGKDAATIIARLDQIKQSIKAYFMVADLSHLHRGGRLNGAQAIIGSMLQVKPILHFVETKIVPFEKIRTEKKAMKRIFQLFEEDASTGAEIKATIIHANREDDANQIKQQLESQYNNVEVIVSYFGPVIGTHLGEGALGLSWYKK
ncbi:DegV family protein [Gracilibacillus xinjiangensis]|uniref:DegV family protein n=1 Tax=Gracilibacillus xinjiangensis TaxID=1193282 RepID=A0ABV8WX03_9BACI